MNTRSPALVVALLLLTAFQTQPRHALAQYRPSDDSGAFRTFDLYADRAAAVGTSDHVNLSPYPSSLQTPTYMVIHTAGSTPDTVALLNSQPYDATGFEANALTPSPFAEFAVVPPRLASSLGLSINAYSVFAGFNQFNDFLKPLATITVTYEDNSTWTTTLRVEEHIRGWFQSNITCGPDLIFPATTRPYDPFLVQLHAANSRYMDMQELRLPPTHLKVTKVRVAALILDHFCNTSVSHIYAGFHLHSLSLWSRFHIANRAGEHLTAQRQDSTAWGAQPYGGFVYNDTLYGAYSTIARTGCALTSYSMLDNYLGATARPDSINAFLQRRGFGNGYLLDGALDLSSAGSHNQGDLVAFSWIGAPWPVGSKFLAIVRRGSPLPIADVVVADSGIAGGRVRIDRLHRPWPPEAVFGASLLEANPVSSTIDYSAAVTGDTIFVPLVHQSGQVRDSVERALADSLPVMLQVAHGGHWVVAEGMTPKWTSSTAARGTYSVVDPAGPALDLYATDGNDYSGGIRIMRKSDHRLPRLATSSGIGNGVALVLNGPAALYLVDPTGRRVQLDGSGGAYESDIEGAVGIRGTRVVDVVDPTRSTPVHDLVILPGAQGGDYTVNLIGIGTGDAGLTAQGWDGTGASSADAVTHALTPGTLARYELHVGSPGSVAFSFAGFTAVGLDPAVSGIPLRVVPNPLTLSSVVSWESPRNAEGDLSMWDVAGRRVVTLLQGPMSAGRHEVRWSASTLVSGELPPGLYFLRLQVGDVHTTARVVVLGGTTR